MGFKEVKAEELTMNPFTKIGKEWLLITAGNEEKCNTMTASWGAMGVMWGKNAVTVYIRPQRYTKEFVDHFCSRGKIQTGAWLLWTCQWKGNRQNQRGRSDSLFHRRNSRN